MREDHLILQFTDQPIPMRTIHLHTIITIRTEVYGVLEFGNRCYPLQQVDNKTFERFIILILHHDRRGLQMQNRFFAVYISNTALQIHILQPDEKQLRNV